MIRNLSRSFAGGEITPEMADRVDLGQYQTGLAQCLNAIIYPHGPAQKRGGTGYVNRAKYWWEGDSDPVYDRNVNLVPFQFSADQSYMLEVGHQYIRFHTENGTLLEGVDITAESIRSEGVNSGAPNRVAVMKKNHRLTAGKKIYIVASPVAPVGTQIGSIPAATAVCTGNVSGFTFTNAAHTSGSFVVGQYLFGTGIQPGTYITAPGTGTGGAGTYTVSHSITATGSITITGKAIYPMADNINKNDYWEVSSLGSAFLGVPAGINYLLRAKRNDPHNIATSVAGSIAGTTFTDTTHGDGAYAVGHRLFGVGIPDGTYITAMDPTGAYTGTGVNNGGTYQVNNACAVAGIAITGRKEDSTMWELVPLENWAQFDGVSEYTVENPDDDMFYIDVDSTLTSQPGPSLSYTKISRAKKAKVTCVSAHGFNDGDLVYFTIENANPATINFDISIPYKVSDKADKTFLLKYEVIIDDETGETEWQYFNSKKAFKKKKIPIGKVGTGQLTPDVDISAVSYTIIREVFCYDPNVFTQISHGFYSGQIVWLDPADVSVTRPDHYEVRAIDNDTFNLYEIDGGIVVCDAGVASAGYVYPVYEVATSYDHEDVRMLDFSQSYDVITVTHKNYPTVTLSRFGAAEWLMEVEVFIPTIDIPSGCSAKPSGNTGLNKKTIYYAVTAVEGQDESFPAYVEREPIEVTKISNRIQYQAIPTFIGTGYYNNPTSIFVLTGVGFKLASGRLPFGASIRLDAGDDMSDDFISAFEGEEMNDSYYRVVGVLTNGWHIVSRRSKNAVDWVEFDGDLQPGDLNCYRAGSVSVDFSVASCKVALTWQAKPDTTYNIYKRVGGSGGDPLGYIGRSEIGFFTDDNITPDLSLTPPTGASPFETTGNYPACVDYFEQRKVFAGTINRPQTIWMTRTASERNMLQSLPTRSTDSINFRMAGREQNAIKFMAALQDLIMFTENSEWRVGATEGSVLTPSSVSVKQQSANGCADVKPVVANNAILFVQSGSNRVLKLNYNWNAQSYAADDVSMLAYHLFENKTITVMTLERGTFPILWCVRSDGILLALTFIPEQNVIAWHRHETDGEVIAARAIKEQSGPVVYLAVRRALTQGSRLLIERMDNYTNWLSRKYLDSERTVSIPRPEGGG